MVADYISMMLEDLGCTVVGPVASIDQALTAVSESGFDGALLGSHLGSNPSDFSRILASAFDSLDSL